MVTYWSLKNNRNLDALKFGPLLEQGLVEKHCSGFPRPVHNHPPTELLPKRHRIKLPGVHFCHQNEGKISNKMCDVYRIQEKGENLCIGAVNEKQQCA
jgi:hypothetical protein